jgi:hypothetical protein
MTRSNLIEIEVTLHHETKPDNPDEGAVLVSLDGDRKRAVWVPKSRCQREHKRGDVFVLTLSELLAQEKGLC